MSVVLGWWTVSQTAATSGENTDTVLNGPTSANKPFTILKETVAPKKTPKNRRQPARTVRKAVIYRFLAGLSGKPLIPVSAASPEDEYLCANISARSNRNRCCCCKKRRFFCLLQLAWMLIFALGGKAAVAATAIYHARMVCAFPPWMHRLLKFARTIISCFFF